MSTSPLCLCLPHRPSLPSHHRAVPRHRVAVVPSTAVAPHCPSPSIHHHAVHHRPSVVLSVYRRRTRNVPCRRGAVMPSTPLRHTVHRRQFTITPSITAHPLCSRSIAAALALSLAVEEPSRRPWPSRSRCAVPCRRGAVAPSITVKDRCCIAPSPSTCPSQSSRSSPHWRRHRPAPDDLRPRRQPLPPPLLVLLAPAALLAPLRAFALADHPHLSPPAPIEATAPPLLSSP